ncbi:NodT family efflux transporter outer membrane factor (OMF) lipoprotein [Sphingomonas jinjuensis]|uniref:NodT family efflux transporter outer membrane factor (OMF) lipoprotein n=1 Tax=Sphingomonas jinjuensis TaxID=535907 RepID=A0A840F1X5_9SPHN|nr:efflux transporter outer membrane subunit [Sphingomonas jinjuensis]MBB4153353.1 NodT family efflux transporter outer membrane factor (OMF) lipoprotein [Sphingomonas jinjuensis]
MRRLLIAMAASTAMLAGCTVGPDYHPADPVAVPASFAGPQAAGPGVDVTTWWTAFGDPQLDALIERALRDSPDIGIAAARVRQARLQEIVARSAGGPQVNASANATHIEFSKNAGFASLARLFGGGGGAGGAAGGSGSSGGIALPGSGITTYAAGFDASWELDVFGGVRRGVQAATARTEAAEWNRRDAAVMIAGEVAQAYLALRTDQAQVAVIEAELVRQRGALAIAGDVAKVGLVPPIDVTRQRGQITNTEARLAPIRADIDIRRHALAILLAQPPAALDAELAAPGVVLPPAPAIPAGLPSDLLKRRPDVRAAERNVAAASADIGVATADLYPHFSLTGMAQLISTALSNLISRDSLQLTGTGGVQLPLLDGGRRRATVKLREAQRDEAVLQYRGVVLQALRDVEDTLSQIAAERLRHEALSRAVADAAASERAIGAQYRTGFVAQDALLNAEAQSLSAREQLALSDAALRQQTVALFKALGGGWSPGDGVR